MTNTGAAPLTINNGANLSSQADFYVTDSSVALQMPASWTTADLTVQASFDGVTFTDMYLDDGTEMVIKAGASRWIVLNITRFLGVRSIKLRSGTASVPVNQGGQRTIYLVYA